MAGMHRAGKGGHGSTGRKRGAHHRKSERQPYAWLGAGAVTLGLGVALANGSALAYAEDTDSTSAGPSSATSDSSAGANASSTDDAATDNPEASGDGEGTPTDDATADDETEGVDDDAVDEVVGSDETVVDPSEPEVEPEVEEDDAAPLTSGSSRDDDVTVPSTDGVDIAESLSDTSPTEDTPSDETVTVTASDVGAADNDPEPITAATHADTDVAAFSITTDATAADAPAPVTLQGMVTDVLTWIGLGPLAGAFPIPALPVPSFVEALWVAVRQNVYSWNNQRPVATTTISGQDPLTGVITGSINGTDYEGDPITYIVTTEAAHGTVGIDADGNFTYTPDAAYALTGGPDSFVVTLDDRVESPHSYGLLGALGILGPTTTALSLVVLPVLPPNRSPQAGTPSFTYTVNPVTGVVAGTVDVTDPDGDHLDFLLDTTVDPAVGTLVVNQETGSWTYTPTLTAREAAYATPDSDVLPFSITVSDGEFSIGVEVTAPITELVPAPANQAPVAGSPAYSYTVDPTTGVVTGTLTVTDPDGDTLDYSASPIDPAQGTLLIDATSGNWTYTPTQAAREAAYATPDSDSMEFSVTVTDGRAEIVVDITAPITELAPAPVNHAPVAGSPAYEYGVEPNTGVVTGTLTVTDPDGDTLDYSVNPIDPAQGTLTIDANTGNWTYTPTQAAREAAYTTPDSDVLPFSITVSDGEFSIGVEVTAPITELVPAPANQAPVAGSPAYSYTVDPTTGVVTGTLTVTDPDGDTLAYSANPIDPTQGTLTIDAATGNWSYTPTQAARELAYGTPDSDTLPVTFTVTDGQAEVTIAVAVTISPDEPSLDAPGPYTVTKTFGPFTRGWANSNGQGLAVGPDGLVYVIEENGLTVLDPDDRSTYTLVEGTYAAVATARDGRIYLLDNDGNLNVINAEHTSLRTVRVGGTPREIAVGTDNRAYVLGPNSTITVINTDFTTRSIDVSGVPGRSGITDIAVGPDGYIWGNSDYNQSVALINPDTHEISTMFLGLNRDATDIQVGLDGHAYVIDPATGTVTVLSHNGSVITRDGIIDTGYVRQATVSPYGDLLVSGGDSLTVINPISSGTDHLVYSMELGTGGGLDIAVGQDGRLYMDSALTGLKRTVVELDFSGGVTDPTFHYTRTDASSLYRHLRDVTENDDDGLVIERIIGGDGVTRLIVYLGGTTPRLDTSNQPILDNLAGATGTVKDDQKALILHALSEHPGAEVMLVGYSQGGMDAQVLATKAGIPNVTTLVTYGSPIVEPPISGIHTVHFADEDDLIVNTFSQPSDTAANAGLIITLDGPTNNDDNPLEVHGNRRTYTAIAGAFYGLNSSPGSNFWSVKEDLKRFEGVVTNSYGTIDPGDF